MQASRLRYVMPVTLRCRGEKAVCPGAIKMRDREGRPRLA